MRMVVPLPFKRPITPFDTTECRTDHCREIVGQCRGGHRIDRLFRTVPLSAGEKLGPYEVLARIGAGGMGDVWKACDSRLNRTVALKVSKVAFSERFEREARLVA